VKRLFVAVIILAIGAGVILVSGQDDQPDFTVGLCEEAQVWYEDINQFNLPLLENARAMFDADNSSEFREAREAYRMVAEDMEAFDYPECVTFTRDKFVNSDDHLMNAAEALSQGDTNQYFADMTAYNRAIGEGRGYLVALGVELRVTDEETEDE